MKNRKGFTLVELLAVLVIMGIILGISIPAVTAIQKRLVKQRVNTFYRVVDEAANAYVEQYHEDFSKSNSCFAIPYDQLVKEGLLKEEDISCLSSGSSSGGVVYATRVNNGETFTYDYRLTCYDKTTSANLVKSSSLDAKCLGVNGGFTIEGEATKDNNGYDGGNWVRGPVVVNVNFYNPYFENMRDIQYRSGDSFEWKNDGSVIEDSGPNGHGSITFNPPLSEDSNNSSINTTITVRTVDEAGNISGEEGPYTIKVDNTQPYINNISANKGDGSSANSNWTNQNVTVSWTTNNVPSGINEYKLELNNKGEITYKTISNSEGNGNTYTIDYTFEGTIRVEATSNSGIESARWSEPITLKVDKESPTCTTSGGNANWTTGDITLIGTCHDTGGSNCKGNVTLLVNVDKNERMSPGQVCDNAGNCTQCPADQEVHIDKTAPTCTSSGGSDNWTNADITLVGTCHDSGSSCKGNVTKLYNSNTNVTNQTPGEVCDNLNHCVTCPADQTVKIDKSAPTCVSSGGNTNWQKTSMTLIGTCSDTGGSNCKGNASKPFTANTNLSNQTPGQVCDNANNCVTCPANQTVKIDLNTPTVSDLSLTNRFTSQPTVSATCTDSGGSGVNASATISCSGGTCTATCTDGAGNSASKSKSYTKGRHNVCGTESYTYSCTATAYDGACPISYTCARSCCTSYRCARNYTGTCTGTRRHCLGVVYDMPGDCPSGYSGTNCCRMESYTYSCQKTAYDACCSGTCYDAACPQQYNCARNYTTTCTGTRNKECWN